MIHFRVPRGLIGQRVGTLLVAVVAQIGGRRDGFVGVVAALSAAAAAADNDARRRASAAASAAALRRNVLQVVLRRAHPPQSLVLVATAAASGVDRTLRIAVQRQRTCKEKIAKFNIEKFGKFQNLEMK